MALLVSLDVVRSELCEQLTFARLGNDWPALAQDAARDGAGFSDFLEKVLASEHVAHDPLEAHISNAAGYIRHSCSTHCDLGSDLEEARRRSRKRGLWTEDNGRGIVAAPAMLRLYVFERLEAHWSPQRSRGDSSSLTLAIAQCA